MRVLVRPLIYGAITLTFYYGTFWIANEVTYAIMSAAPQETNARVLRTVKAICDISHVSDDGALEDACGAAQDASNTEYICEQPNSTVNFCHVDDKKGEDMKDANSTIR